MTITKLTAGLFVLTLLSCKHREIPKSEQWLLVEHSFFTNTATKEGYLDSTRQRTVFYQRGIAKDSVNELVTRSYQGREKVTEMYFKGGPASTNLYADHVITKLYDHNGRLLQETVKRGDTLLSFSKNTYDTANRLLAVEHISLKADKARKPDDSAQLTTKGFIAYDTIRTIYVYSGGNNTEVLNKDTKGNVVSQVVSLYAGKDRFASYLLNGKDTVRTTNYSKQGKLDKKVERYNHAPIQVTVLSARGRVLSSLTENEKTGSKVRDAMKYDRHTGFLLESKQYVLVKDTVAAK